MLFPQLIRSEKKLVDECREYDLEQSEVEGVALRSALIGAGHGVHWSDVDEDLSVEGLLH